VDDTFIFASEIKAILKYPGFKRELNLKAVSSYLSYRYEIGHETLFNNIFKLMPGHYMSIKDGKIKVKEYWDIGLDEHKELSEESYKREIKRLFKKSVELRMISDVPLGAYLSGGLDSSIIVALMSKLSNNKVKAYSIGFKEEGYNEFHYSRQVANMCKIDYKEITLSTKNYLQNMKKLIRFKDLPLSVPNEVPIYMLSKELKKDITVVLSGEGADELFSGYGKIFRSPIDYKKLKLMKHLPLFVRKKLFKHLMIKYKNKQFNSEMEHFVYNYSYFPLEEKKFIFNEKMNSTIRNDEHVDAIFKKYFRKARKSPYYRKIEYVFEKIHLPGLLARLDCPTMATSVEGRVPFVDHNLVEFMFKVPVKYKMKWKSLPEMLKSFDESSDEISEKRDTTKYILKETFKHMLPESVVQREKKGFPVPLDTWFRGYVNKVAKRELLNKNSKIQAIVDQKNLKRWMDSNLKDGKDKSFGQKVWMLLNLEYWLREYFN
jgi:asparagine synthase (glutamine-hydrolysing)